MNLHNLLCITPTVQKSSAGRLVLTDPMNVDQYRMTAIPLLKMAVMLFYVVHWSRHRYMRLKVWTVTSCSVTENVNRIGVQICKDAQQVVNVVHNAGLAQLVARLKPVIVVKG